MSQAARGLAYALLVLIVLWVSSTFEPDVGTPLRPYAGAALLVGIALLGFVASLRWSDVQPVVTNLALSAASLAVVGLISNQVVPVGTAAGAQIQAVGLVVILVVGALFVLMVSAPTVSWSKLPAGTTVAALLLVLAYAATIVYMLNNAAIAAVTETVWARYLVIFSAVQGVGLAAVGALLGTQVKQGEVNAAQKDVRTAVNAADVLHNAPAPAGSPLPTAAEAALARQQIESLRGEYA
jgi:hypothetical protein